MLYNFEKEILTINQRSQFSIAGREFFDRRDGIAVVYDPHAYAVHSRLREMGTLHSPGLTDRHAPLWPEQGGAREVPLLAYRRKP